MFLSGMNYTPSHFDFLVGHGVSCDKSAVAAEIHYIADVDTSAVTVDMVGNCIVLEGSVQSLEAAEQIERIAASVVGADRVISRLVSFNQNPDFKLLV